MTLPWGLLLVLVRSDSPKAVSRQGGQCLSDVSPSLGCSNHPRSPSSALLPLFGGRVSLHKKSWYPYSSLSTGGPSIRRFPPAHKGKGPTGNHCLNQAMGKREAQRRSLEPLPSSAFPLGLRCPKGDPNAKAGAFWGFKHVYLPEFRD